MNCPACGAPMRLDSGAESLTCDYCHSVYFPGKNDDGVRVLGAATEDTCPVCGIPLMDASLAGTRIRYCTCCRGMSVAMDIFAALVEAVRAGQEGAEIPPTPPDPSELRRRLNCPHCHQTMDTHFYAGPGDVVLSDCEHCLLDWLDHGKLMRIAHGADAMRDGGEDPS